MDKNNPDQEQEKASLPNEATHEVGTRGEMLVSSYNSEEFRIDDLTIRDYRRMKDNDGQVQMLLMAIYGSILGAGVDFIDDEDYDIEQEDKLRDKDAVESPELTFIKGNLLNPLWKKGMSRDFLLTNKSNLRAFEEGYRVSEIVYRVDDDGMIRLDRLAPRAIRLSDFEMKLITDNYGNFYGFHQITYFRSGVIDVIVVNDSEIAKTINVVFGEEYGSNYGRSALKAVWYHYDKAHKGMYLNHVGHELGAVKYRKVEKKALTTQEKDQELMDILAKVGQNASIIYNQNDYALTFESVSDASVMNVGKDMITYHTQQMSKALLAQFIDLGVLSTHGSRSTSDSGKEFFRAGLKFIAQTLIENPWNKVIADLIKINFNRGVYPRLQVKEIDDKDITLLYDSFLELAKQGKLGDKMTTQLESKTASRLGLDISEEDIETEQEEEKAEQNQPQNNPNDPMGGTMKVGKDIPKIPELSEPNFNDVMLNPRRDLYPDEKKVKLAAIKRKMDDSRTQYESLLQDKLTNQKQGVISKFIASFRSKKPVSNIDLAEPDTTYSDELSTMIQDLFEYGKVLAANELNKAVPETTKKKRKSLLDNLALILEEQASRLKLRLQLVVNNAIQNNLPENQLQSQLGQEYDNFFNTVVAPTLGNLVPDSLNKGRAYTFDAYKPDVFAYRYTSVLEPTTCPYCRSLDGAVFQDTDPNYAILTPPNHFGCLCVWTPITQSESNGVQVTGKPEELPAYSSVSSFKQINNTEHKHESIDFEDENIKEVEKLLELIQKKKDKTLEEISSREVDQILISTP